MNVLKLSLYEKINDGKNRDDYDLYNIMALVVPIAVGIDFRPQMIFKISDMADVSNYVWPIISNFLINSGLQIATWLCVSENPLFCA